ncbi:MAG: RNA methyltransferase [Firmicutes bacterium]|nr:RNA methyltransferase [Bacillota bacterium]
MNQIASARNPLIKNFMKVVEGKGPKEAAELPLEGVHLIREAINSGVFVEQFFYAPEIVNPEMLTSLLHSLPADTMKIAVSKKIFKVIAQTENPQGVAALVSYPTFELEKIIARPNLLGLVADTVQDPGNLGTMIRSSAAAGLDAVFLTPGTVRLSNPKMLRSTAGALFHVPVLFTGDIHAFWVQVRARDIAVIGAHPRAERYYFEEDFCRPSLIVIGNENRGISRSAHPVDSMVRIPLVPEMESINASVAAGIIIYEAWRQRAGQGR